MFKTNVWNKIRYTAYLPVYDIITNLFAYARKNSIALAEIKPDDKILIVGAGTGLDLPYLKQYKNITATDITPAMISKLKRRADKLGMSINAQVMDGQNLEYENDKFDVVILHLILAVIPDPVKCIKEVERVLKPGGRVAVFDKFLTADQPSLIRKILNPVSIILFTDINRRIEDIIRNTKLTIEINKPVLLNGFFRTIKLIKTTG